jgi:RNA polymerase sigma factor (sigma-70 family)
MSWPDGKTTSRGESEMTDEELHRAWQSGDRLAGETLFERHFESIYRFFDSKLRGDVSDLVQRTFLACVESRDRFRGASSFRTFLFAVARYELCGFYRARRREAVLDFSISSVADLATTPSSVARRRSARAALVDALQSLPLDLQIALELRYWEGFSGPDLAVVLEVPEGTVRSRLRRAIETLRDAMSRRAELASMCPPEGTGELEGWAEALSRSLPAARNETTTH